ncbi:hypothetical protein OPIT5_06050 [Opitutaceae bacterium TAV5]|nr:hypothetical protein OPIT5_06050 [Opitutaceae bacterium TAV5]
MPEQHEPSEFGESLNSSDFRLIMSGQNANI